MPNSQKSAEFAESDELTLTVSSVARRLGVAPATLRTWDRRYGIGPSKHDSGKNRLYSLADVAKLDYMRNLVLQGVTPAKAAQLAAANDLPPAKLQPAALGDSSEARNRLPNNVVALDSPKNLIRGLTRAATMLDQESCRKIIGQLIDSKGVVWVWDNVLVETLQALGQKWEQTGQGIEVEHLIVEVIESEFRIIATSINEPVNTKPILLACTAHELHTLPIYAIAAALAQHNISCRILGPRLPAESLAAAVSKIGPSAVLVWSQTKGTAEPELWKQISQQRPLPKYVAAGPGWIGTELTGVSNPSNMTETLLLLASTVAKN